MCRDLIAYQSRGFALWLASLRVGRREQQTRAPGTATQRPLPPIDALSLSPLAHLAPHVLN